MKIKKRKVLTIDELVGFPEGTYNEFISKRKKEEEKVETERLERLSLRLGLKKAGLI